MCLLLYNFIAVVPSLGFLDFPLFDFQVESLRCSSDETTKAKDAGANVKIGAPTIFSKIIDRSIPANVIYEDDQVTFCNYQMSLVQFYGAAINIVLLISFSF